MPPILYGRSRAYSAYSNEAIAMSVTGEIKAAASDVSWARWAWRNAARGVAAIVRSPRVKVRSLGRGHSLLLVGAIAAIAIVMIAIDARVAVAMKQTPRWLYDIFDYLTDYGRSGWLLGPIGVSLLAIAAL